MFSANLLVATGKPYENGQKTELINLIDPNIENEVLDSTPARSGSIGAFIQNKLIIFGGSYYGMGNYLQDGFIIGQSDIKFQMLEKRYQASSVVLDKTKVNFK